MKRILSLLTPVVLLLCVSIAAAAQDATPRTCTITAATYTDKMQCDVYEADATSNAITLTLIAPSKRRVVVVTKTDSSNNAVTIATAGTGATINGSSSYVLRQQNEGAILYANGKTGSSGVWRVAAQKDKPLHYAEISISAADITSTSSGKLGHANGYPLVAAPGSGLAIELVSAIVSFTYSTAAYGGGGNVTVNYAGGGAALSGAVSAANSLGASGNKLAILLPTTPTNNQLSSNTGLNLVAASAFTQPGTAAGTVKVKIVYRIHGNL